MSPADPVVRFETAPGDQMQIDWIEFRKGADPLYAFCATLGYSRVSHVEFVTDELLAKLPRRQLLRRSIRSRGAIFLTHEAGPAELLT